MPRTTREYIRHAEERQGAGVCVCVCVCVRARATNHRADLSRGFQVFLSSEQKWKSGPWRLYLDSDYFKLEGGGGSIQAKQAIPCPADVNKIVASKGPAP